MSSLFKIVALGTLALAGMSASAMPVGLRIAMMRSRDGAQKPEVVVYFDMMGGDGGALEPLAFGVNTVVSLPKVTSTKDGHVFAGWSLNPNGGKVWNDQQQVFIDYAVALSAYAIWLRPNCYGIAFDPGVYGAAWSMDYQSVELGKVAKLNTCAFAAPVGKRFAGWRRKDNGRRYDDGMLVFNLASDPGAVVVLEAVWEDIP